MKLRNKKTGEIGYTAVLRSKAIVVMDENAIQLGSYTSLAKLNEEWEDYEEPKEYWYIDCDGDVYSSDRLVNFDLDRMFSINNCFESVEEAEKAVEKLKAWKRLKDNGFKFGGWKRDKIYYGNYIIKGQDYSTCNDEALDLLFGGEE